MALLLFVAFLTIPLAELFVIGSVADMIGLPWTIVLLVLDSLVGAWLVRREGRRAWGQLAEALGAGRWPGDEITAGALVLVGGVLLVTPGFLTDVLGLALVLPFTRMVMARALRSRVQPDQMSAFTTGTGGSGFMFGTSFGSSAKRADPFSSKPGEVFDAEIISIERETPDEPGELGPGGDDVG